MIQKITQLFCKCAQVSRQCVSVCVCRVHIYKVVSCIVYNISCLVFSHFGIYFTVTHIDRFSIFSGIYIRNLSFLFCFVTLLLQLSLTLTLALSLSLSLSLSVLCL